MATSQGYAVIAAAVATLLCVSAAAGSPASSTTALSAFRGLGAGGSGRGGDGGGAVVATMPDLRVPLLGALVTPNAENLTGVDVEFHIHTRLNPVNPQVVAINTTASPVDTSVDLVVLLHGFTGSVSSKSVTLIRDALLFKLNVTVVAVQWAYLARGPWYDEAAGNTLEVARHLLHFLKNLEEKGLDLKRVHIIGFSLGAHVAGITGALLEGRIGRISGLDPARPGFETRNSSGRLDASDAQFVFGLHTGAGFLSMSEPVGHADFYPNGGSKQPHCQTDDIPLVCNHFMAYTYFAESIYNPDAFPSQRCSSWAHFDEGVCVVNEVVLMGYHTPNITRGTFFLQTNAQEPYGLGPSYHLFDLGINESDSRTTASLEDTTQQEGSPSVSLTDGDHHKDIYSVDGLGNVGGIEVQSRNDLDSTTHLLSSSCKLSYNLISILFALFTTSYFLF